jgi:hypothetical protein
MAVPTPETFEAWRDGYGPTRHGEETDQHIQALAASGRIEPDRLLPTACGRLRVHTAVV